MSIADNCTNVNQIIKVKRFEEAPIAQAHELVVIIRPSFKKFCQDACRAALFNHFLFWIAWKSKDQLAAKIQAGLVTYYATTNELVECMAESWSEKKIRTEVNALIELGVIGLTKNQKWKTDRTKHFYFGRDQYKNLLELCDKYHICLAHIGLPKEVIQMLAAFSETVACPCSGQTVNLPNANGKSTECNESILPDATSRFYRSNNKDNYKDCNKDIYERENRERQQKDSGDSSHPSTRPSRSSQKFSSENEKQKEIILTEPGQHIYDFACKTLFTAKKPKITKKLKDECEDIAVHVKTFEQFESLLQYVQSKFAAPYHLKNMVNALNDWLQLQNTANKNMQGLEWLPISHADPEPTQESIVETYLPEASESIPQVVEDVEIDDVTEDELVDKMESICKYYGQDSYLAVCCNTLADIRDEYRLNNATLYDCMTEACRQIEWNRTPGVQAFFDEMYGSLAQAS